MATLEEDMLAQTAPPQQGIPQQQPTSLSPVGDVMRQGVQDATGDFITTMIEMLESKGIDLDDIMNPTVEEFNALAPEVQAELESAFIKELPPRFVQRLRAVQRMVGGR